MAINFSAQFIINEKTSTRVLRLTDTSTGFTLSKGNFLITFPDDTKVANTDFVSPQISAPGGNVSISLITDIDNTVLTGIYVITYVALDTSLNQYSKTETFDFNWEKPVKEIINESDVVLPEVKFKDLTPYETQGSFSGVLTRNFFTLTPSTSEVGALTKTSVGDILTPSNASKFYEGIYLVKSDISVLYTHSSKSWLTVSYVDLLQETYDIREAPTQDELVALMNTYKSQIEAYKTTSPDEYAIRNEEYDLVVALYSHIIARFQTNTLAGSKSILDHLLGLLPPTNPYTYKATQMLPFTINFTTSLTGSGTTGTIPKFTGVESVGDSIIKEDTGKIGIGKAPATTLDVNGTIKGTSIVKDGGTSAQFLKADGTVDSSTYLTGVSWGNIAGTLSNQTDLQNALNSKAPLASPAFTGTVSGITKSMVGLSNVDNTTDLLKPISAATQDALDLKYDASNPSGYISGITSGQVTTALGFTPENAANKGVNNGYAGLDGAGKVPSSQLPSYVDDVVEVANYAALPATGETGKIYITLDTNFMYRWSGSTYIEIKDSSAVWGAITGTLSSQTDLQNALNAKFDDPIGDTTQYIAGDGSLITFPIAGQSGTLVREIRNTTGATLTKGTIVYISGATGNKPTVSKAIATGDSTSAQTFGMCQANIANNSNGYVVCIGDLTGLDTSAFTEGNQLYLSSTTAGTYTATKQLAPAHLVYIGVVTRAHPTQGQIEVKIQNGYELNEIHDVAISSLANNQGLFYESSTNLWKNKSIATVLGYTPVDASLTTNYVPKATGATTLANSNIQDSGTLITLGSNTTISSGGLGINTTSLTGYNLRVSKNITGANTGYGIVSDSAVQSDVTNTANYFLSNASTAATAFTLSSIFNFRVQQGSIGAGSTVINNYGFAVDANLIGATNNYGFRGAIPSGTNRWNLYMDGTANNYLAGNLLLNTTTDSGFRLDVNGTARVQGALTGTGNASFNGVAIGLGNTTNTNNSNTAVGLEALQSNTSALNCTAVGQSALRNNNANNNSAFGKNTLRLNTSGTSNSAFGTEALFTNNGSQNNAFGYNALYFNTTGSDNNAFGWSALVNNTTGSGNIGIGTVALQFQTTGINNVAVGSSAGRYISGGVTQNTISNNSIFIGASAFPLANNETNQTVIGYNQTGLGSNTTIIGGVGNTLTAVVGKLLVNTTTDAGFTGLDVNGTARVQGILTATSRLNVNGAADSSSYAINSNGSIFVGNANGLYGDDFRYIIPRISGGTYNTMCVISGGNSGIALLSDVIISDALAGGNYTRSGLNVRYSPSFRTAGTTSNFIDINASINGFVDVAQTVNHTGFLYNPTISDFSGGTATINLTAIQTVRGNVLLGTTSGNVAIATSTLGTATKLTLGGSQTASSAIARGQLLNTTLVAAANNDVLVGLDINPTFTNGAFTGVTNYAARFSGSTQFIGSISPVTTAANGLIVGMQLNATANNNRLTAVSINPGFNNGAFTSVENYSLLVLSGVSRFNGGIIVSSFLGNTSVLTSTQSIYGSGGQFLFNNGSGAGFNFDWLQNSTTAMRLSTGNNLLLNTTTDAGFRLDVNGTTRFSGTSRIDGDLQFFYTGIGTRNINFLQGFGSSTVEVQLSVETIQNRLSLQGINTPLDFFAISTSKAASGSSTDYAFSVTSTTKGILFPRMTTVQKNAIRQFNTTTLNAGLVVYDTTLNKLSVYTGAAWETVTSI